MALDELHDQRSDGGHRPSLEESYGNVSGKKIARVFRHKFPVNFRSSLKNHFKIPGIFKTILGNESAVSLWRKRHFFSQRSKPWRGFPPAGLFMICVFKNKVTVYHLLLHCDTHNDFLNHGILTSPNGLDISIQRRWELTDKPSDTPNGQQTMEKWCSKVDSKAWDLWALKL